MLLFVILNSFYETWKTRSLNSKSVNIYQCSIFIWKRLKPYCQALVVLTQLLAQWLAGLLALNVLMDSRTHVDKRHADSLVSSLSQKVDWVGWVLKNSGNFLFERHWNFTIWTKGSWDNLVWTVHGSKIIVKSKRIFQRWVDHYHFIWYSQSSSTHWKADDKTISKHSLQSRITQKRRFFGPSTKCIFFVGHPLGKSRFWW